MLKLVKINKEKMAVAYKLLHDSLLVLLVFFVLTLIAEGLLPGIISSHFGLYKFVILILGNILVIFAVERVAEISANSNINKKIAFALIFIMLLLVVNSLIKLNIFLNLFIASSAIAVAFFVSKILQEGEL